MAPGALRRAFGRGAGQVLTMGVVAASLGACRTAPARREVARIVQSVGVVHVSPAGGMPLAKAGVGTKLRARDRVVTGGDAWVFLAFADGPKVLVGQGAEFLIEEATDDDVFLLLRNAALGARLAETRGRRVTLRTPSAVAELRPGDCTFRLLVDAATGSSVWDVLGGELRLRDNFGHEVLVRAGQRASANTTTGFGGRPALPFPPALQEPPRPAREEPRADRAAAKEALIQPPVPPATAPIVEPAGPPQTASGTVRGMAFPPVPRFDELDSLLEDLDWSR